MILKTYSPTELPKSEEKEAIIDFLFEQLEQYGDPRSDIEKCINYALKLSESFGGLILTSTENDRITGTVVINKTGMNGYIPDNILVYIATHREHRGKGLGKKLMQKTIEMTQGDIALHVEPDNPARFLYEKVGFTNKYLEMRYKK